MLKLQVFDPAMCCSSGVCGPSVDPTLPRFAADLEWLQSKGVQVERYNLARDLAAFTRSAIVKKALNSSGTKCLPMLLLDGNIISSGGYPSRKDRARLTKIPYEPAAPVKARQADLVTIGCCKGD